MTDALKVVQAARPIAQALSSKFLFVYCTHSRPAHLSLSVDLAQSWLLETIAFVRESIEADPHKINFYIQICLTVFLFKTDKSQLCANQQH